MKEIFKPIPNYTDYQVSNIGRIKSNERIDEAGKLRKERVLKPTNNGFGYLQIRLSKNKNTKIYQVHQLVAIAFLNHKINGHKIVVDHINHKKTDNRVENLRLVTQRQNASHLKRETSSKYTGVYWSKRDKRWIARIRINGVKKQLGVFTNEYEAYLEYQKALKTIHYLCS